MKTLKTAFFLSFLLVLTLVVPARAASEDGGRYFIKSTSVFIKKSLGVRHAFPNGFSADLSPLQLGIAKLFQVEVTALPRLTILDDAVAVDGSLTASPAPSASPSPDTSPFQSPQVRPIPLTQVPWGVRAMYNDGSAVVPSGGKDITVAVLDTGATVTHPDLARRTVGCKDFTDDTQPIADKTCDDANGHGTHVAGIIVADGGRDGKGIYGVAPETNLLVYKVCGADGSCWADDVAMALRSAVDSGAEIIVVAIGTDTDTAVMHDAVAYAHEKHVLVVAAVGNDGPDGGTVDYPAAYDDVVGVGAVDNEFSVSDWSSRRADTETPEAFSTMFAAPGLFIESTWKENGYAVLSGTSMAAPHIAGLAAKLWDADVDDPAAQVIVALKKLSNDLFPKGVDAASGYGIPTLLPL